MLAQQIIQWQKKHGRHNLPWQQDISAYRVWISEIMLQQTQVSTVIPYYQRFMQKFPDIKTLALSDEDTVIKYWAGLGYYQRARNLHRCAKTVVEKYKAELPIDADALILLPGIGRSTAHAILSITHELPYAIMDGNVKRVLARYYAYSEPLTNVKALREMWQIAESNMPKTECRTYTQGIMDLGANICKRQPLCHDCPLVEKCQAHRLGIAADIPIKTKKKTKRIELKYFICYLFKGMLWTIKRPVSGIWPSLWTPPIADQKPSDTTHQLEAFRHTFTHIHMDIHTVVYKIDEQDELIALRKKHANLSTEPGRWIDCEKIKSEAVPAAVVKCVSLIQSDHKAQSSSVSS
ncbi:MAG: A/G-specific adenine glycosylase [Legionellales bacterium]|nr:A/G-specific adenine glycosylase [Legionellales bacterium]